ncbi:MAG TPA: ATP-binding protein [Longimicrobiaceae bacterium]|nr:ATP-binding protein [Longimicrobiaceae bacterium]
MSSLTQPVLRSEPDIAPADPAPPSTEALAQALAASEARYHRLLTTCPSGIYVLDREGRFVEVNPAASEILGRPAEELIGTDFRKVVAPEDMENAEPDLHALQDGRGPDEVELYVVRPTGERRLLHISRALVMEEGRIVGVQGIGRDVTEERAREMQLRRAERSASIGPLLSGVCHELNNPLTSIKSFAELLLLDERSDEDREAIEIMQREAHRAAKIVSDLRVVARQSQEAGSGRGMVEINDIVGQVLAERELALAADGVRIACDFCPDLPPVWAVRTQVAQVVAHLLSNAERAVRDREGERQITVRTFAAGKHVSFVVRDNGEGIAPESLDRIFDPFWTTRPAGEGTGLGLSLSQGIVSDHGGRIRVDSKPGCGAAFTVDLPSAAQPPLAVGDCPSDASAVHGLRILVVDDEASIRFSLARYLERRGHRVQEADEGEAALALLAQSAATDPFDIILADLRMPGLGGEELLQELRARGDGQEQRLIFMTGDADSPDAERALQDHGGVVVQKPFELAEVAQIIEAQAGLVA